MLTKMMAKIISCTARQLIVISLATGYTYRLDGVILNDANQPSGTVAVANGKMVPGTPLAVMHQSGNQTPRLCIPRIAFEALAFETGEPVVGGQPVYVSQNGDTLTISQNAPMGIAVCSPVNPTTDRLRLHLNVPNPADVGTEYEILVGSDALTIDLGNPQ